MRIDYFEPIVGRVHQPPPVHQTFEGDGFVVCSFCPRPYDFDPEAVPAPYNHSNVDSDEVLYYASSEFMSRKGIEFGSITHHPDGIPHVIVNGIPVVRHGRHTSARPGVARNRNPAFMDLVRRQLARDYPADALRGAGLSILTTLAPSAQQLAEQAGGADVVHQDVGLAALAGDGCPAVGPVEVLDVEAQDLLGAGAAARFDRGLGRFLGGRLAQRRLVRRGADLTLGRVAAAQPQKQERDKNKQAYEQPRQRARRGDRRQRHSTRRGRRRGRARAARHAVHGERGDRLRRRRRRLLDRRGDRCRRSRRP